MNFVNVCSPTTSYFWFVRYSPANENLYDQMMSRMALASILCSWSKVIIQDRVATQAVFYRLFFLGNDRSNGRESICDEQY